MAVTLAAVMIACALQAGAAPAQPEGTQSEHTAAGPAAEPAELSDQPGAGEESEGAVAPSRYYPPPPAYPYRVPGGGPYGQVPYGRGPYELLPYDGKFPVTPAGQ